MTDVTKDIKSTLQEWGAMSPRVRDAVIQGSDDQVLEEYRQLVDDYWRTLSMKAKEH